MAKKGFTPAIGDTVTVPTTVYTKKNGAKIVRRQAIVKGIKENDSVTVLFTTGHKKGMFGFFAASVMKKARTSSNNRYAFGRIVDWS